MEILRILDRKFAKRERIPFKREQKLEPFDPIFESILT